MTDNPKDHDFNWVKATRECTIECEYWLLRDAAKDNYRELVRPAADSDSEATFEFHEKHDPQEFHVVRRTTHEQKQVCFRLNGNKIAVLDINPSGETLRFTLTVNLNEDGECHFRVGKDGKDYLRWQVLRRAFRSLFFE